MLASTAFTFKGYGRIDPVWMRECLQLFRERQINIRKLVLLKNGDPACFSMMEIQFVPSGQDAEAFLARLEECLRCQPWQHRSLGPL